MRSLICYFHIEDFEKVDLIPCLIKVFQYSNADKSNINPHEWGKLVFDELTVKFYGISQFEGNLDG